MAVEQSLSNTPIDKLRLYKWEDERDGKGIRASYVSP